MTKEKKELLDIIELYSEMIQQHPSLIGEVAVTASNFGMLADDILKFKKSAFISILERYNAWRKGEDVEMPQPKDITAALEFLLENVKTTK